MIVNFLPKKNPDFEKVKSFLGESIKQNYFTNNGPLKQLLERKLKDLLGLPDDRSVICVSSGTSALTLLLNKLTRGGKKRITSTSFTFPSVVTGNRRIGFQDIKINSGEPLKEDFLSKIDILVLTNLFGTTIDINKWVCLCKDNNVLLLFDNCGCPLSQYQDKNICHYGDYSFGSLHHTKHIGFGEGGFIVAPKDEYEYLNSLTNFGFLGNQMFKPESSNFKMSDISAAFILSHLDQISYLILKTITVQNKLITKIEEIPNKKFSLFNKSSNILYSNLPIVFDKPVTKEFFLNLGIEVNKYYYPLRQHKNSSILYKKILNFPLHYQLSDYHIDSIIQSLSLWH